MIPWLRPKTPFPPIEQALIEPNGLLAASDDVTPGRLLDAYRHGIFPWYSGDQPVLWWSPDPRMVLFVDEFRIARSLRKRVRQERWEIRADSAFRAVIKRVRIDAKAGTNGHLDHTGDYRCLYRLAHGRYAHSVEAWRDGKLVGGLYGVAIGRMFFGESMFAREADASKVALAHLVAILRARGVPVIDCQQETVHLASFGARPIPRHAFADLVAGLVHSTAADDPWTPVSTSDVLA